jgi:hypothetical protein
MEWDQIVQKATPYIVKIETPAGYGTGFLCLYNGPRTFCGIATALHVVAYADQWQQPIRIVHYSSSANAFLQESERVIFTDRNKDSAVILLPVGKLDLPQELIPLRPIQASLPIGVEVGWLGYPAIGGPDTLCFFSGNISARQEALSNYLIDGVAINGVSGGPVFYSTPTDGLQIVGAVSAYIANRNTGEALPGLSVAQDVSPLHDVASRIASIDEANRRKQEQPPPPTDAPSEPKPSTPLQPSPDNGSLGQVPAKQGKKPKKSK